VEEMDGTISGNLKRNDADNSCHMQTKFDLEDSDAEMQQFHFLA